MARNRDAEKSEANRREIAAEIAREERRVSELRSEMEKRAAHLISLREKLRVVSPPPDVNSYRAGHAPTVSGPASNAEKVALFHSLFRGREDVFPRRWENLKTGKSGYSPVCANEWERGICAKSKVRDQQRRVTCADCPNRAFAPVTDDVIERHLKGTHVIGVYPLLPDETCWFMAADFDKKSWPEDIAAFVETCETNGVPVAVERSRSGNGAHVWFFFAAPIPAVVARQMGCFLITETMASRHQLSMESYDRLFPNQDTLPKGGFGNLIALPLQREVRERGNSVFIDETFTPYADQWMFLAGAERIEPAFALEMAGLATRRGQVIGVRISDTADSDEQTPWDSPPSGRSQQVVIKEPLPSSVRGVLAQQLFIEKAGLPSPLLNQLKRLAAFQNPEFYKRQSMRLSTALTPRVIACAQELAEHIVLPRGCLEDTEALLSKYGVSLSVEDRRETGTPLTLRFQGELTPVQEQAVQALLAHETGILVAPPGMGKSVVGAYLIAARGRSTLVLVHRKPLLDQWVAQLAMFLGVATSKVGRIGAGKSRPNGYLDVAMIQSLVRKGRVDDLVAAYGHVITDECHHLGAYSFERVLSEVKAKYVIGFTATPQRRDGHHPIVQMQLGPVRFAVSPKSQTRQRPFDHKLIVRETSFRLTESSDGLSIQALYAILATDERRNNLILEDVIHALEEHRSPILLTERRDHLGHFAERLRKVTRNLVVLHGGMKPQERREALEQVNAIPDGEERLILATGRYIGEGFDDARLDTLFLALPVSWKGTLVQYTGRLHRLHQGKTEVRIYDYVDLGVPMLAKMFRRRLCGYRAIGYTPDEERSLLDLPDSKRVGRRRSQGTKNEAPS